MVWVSGLRGSCMIHSALQGPGQHKRSEMPSRAALVMSVCTAGPLACASTPRAAP